MNMTQAEIKYRLSEIQATSLQDLDDEAVLALLAERKELLAEEEKLQKKAEEEAKVEKQRKQEEERLAAETKAKEWQAKKEALLAQLETLNKSLTPDQSSEKLLALIQERKVLEAELEVFTATQKEAAEEVVETPKKKEPLPSKIVKTESAPPAVKKEKNIEAAQPEVTVEEPEVETASELEKPESETVLPTNTKITIDENASYTETSHISGKGKISPIEASEERVTLDTSLAGTDFQGYLRELKANINSLGTFLQNLPVEAKRNKSFMLQVAAIDPAYAMHYADKDTLKKDETFNIAIAGMNNQRNTGNPLSEMLPEMRTGAVLIEGVKNDFRNVRFIRPEMPEYDEILTIAKKSALEAASSLKEAHDLKFLLPPVLQKDKTFMAEIEKLVNQK